jgi:kinesin family protein 5
MRAGCEGAFDRRAALRKVLCDDQNRSPASDFGAVVEKQRGAPAPKQVELAKASSADRSAAVLRVDDAEKEILTIAPGCGLRSFRFDDVFEAARGQAFVYDAVARPLVCDLVNLKNGTLFAFGQTGSGKTHSVFGGDGGGADARGVVPRMLAEILGAAKALKRFAPKLAMSYVEIDGDELTDLLKDDAKVAQNAAAAQRWVLEGHAAVRVESLDGALALLDAGHARKKRAATRMNERSSRAHAVLVLTLTRTLSDGGRRSASLFVADLGGSEQLKRSKADADITKAAGKANDDDEGAGWAEYYAQRSRLQEAQKINLGLFALKRVVRALRRGSKFVPWMDSKLTMLLRPGLGGGARTACLVCAAPEPRNALETVHALRFGEQCGALETEQQGGSAFTKAIEALNAKIAAVQKAIEAKERWEERARVVTSKIGTYDDMENETWGGQFEKVGKKWKRAESTTDHATVTHTVVGRVLVGAEAERRDLEALLGQKRALIAHAA